MTSEEKQLRREPRFPENKALKIIDETNAVSFDLQSIDRSRKGLCCQYNGTEALQEDFIYLTREDNKESFVKVRWLKKVDENVFKVGFKYL